MAKKRNTIQQWLYQRRKTKTLEILSDAEFSDLFLGAANTLGLTGASANMESASANHSPDWLRQYNNSPRLAGVNKLASDNGISPFKILTNQGKDTVQIVGHPLEAEIRKLVSPQFFALWTAYRVMTGETYIAYSLKDGIPVDFRVFSRSHIIESPELSKTNYYKFSMGEEEVTYPKSQVLVDLDLDVSSPYNQGFGRMTSFMKDVEMDNLIVTYLLSFYINSTRPDYFVIVKTGNDREVPNDADLQRIATGLNSEHKGATNAHKATILGFDASIVVVPKNHKDIELLETREKIRKTSLQILGIPPEIMGDVENSNKATVVAAEHIYENQVRRQYLRHFERFIEAKIMPLYKDGLDARLVFDPATLDQEEAAIAFAKEMRESQAFQINEYRIKLGYPPLLGDVGKFIIGTNPYFEHIIDDKGNRVDPLATQQQQEPKGNKVIEDTQAEDDVENRRERDGAEERTPGDTEQVQAPTMRPMIVSVDDSYVQYKKVSYKQQAKEFNEQVRKFKSLSPNQKIEIHIEEE